MVAWRVVVDPVGAELEVEDGGSLSDALVRFGVEFPCGGRGQCRGCRIRVAEGDLAITDADRRKLSDKERGDGWRLACGAKVTGPLRVELRQWAGPVLADETPFAFEPAEGLGVAVDVGTTTVVAQLLDLATGRVLGTRSALNPQARWGADVMSRIGAASGAAGLGALCSAIRDNVASLVNGLAEHVPAGRAVRRGVIVGNTVMHHLFLGRSVAPLAAYPFEPERPEGEHARGHAFGWGAPAGEAHVHFLPTLGCFVGSDILGVILATGIHQSEPVVGAADLGTNGELVVGNRDGILVASTAAGPAFEGARIEHGMRAAQGAIDRVVACSAGWQTHVLGGGAARGICGSGLVDAVAVGLDLGLIDPTGRIASAPWVLSGGVALTQRDVRELQLAKGAVACGAKILLDRRGIPPDALPTFFLAGAFGNSVDVSSGRRIGLFVVPAAVVQPVGNAALLGAKMALLTSDLGERFCSEIVSKVQHVSLEQDSAFQDLYADQMLFPKAA
jgi:uncharacterized 2Fe-2S/4Fe-4S cluster protein (DUF4445 family)